jgi:hypothetical protein
MVLEPNQTIPAQFPCEPLHGGLAVFQTVDFVDEWFTDPAGISSSGGTCTTTLYQIPRQQTGRHTYSWRTRQCTNYAGTCSDAHAQYGPIWTFTVEPPSSSSEPTPALPQPPTTPTSPAGPRTPSFTTYIGCGVAPSRPAAHHCLTKRKIGAFFESDRGNVVYKLCIDSPAKKHPLCVPREQAAGGTLNVNAISTSRPGPYEAMWFAQGSLVGVYDRHVAARDRRAQDGCSELASAFDSEN